MAVQNQKQKLLAVMQIFLQRTDENHTMSAQDICKELENTYGITAERKGIYTDVEALQEMGIDIIQNKGSGAGYYVGSREFELAELKLLVDAVQSSKFISAKKSEELIKKIENLTSVHQARSLQRQVVICGRPKTENKNVFITVDGIHSALLENAQIKFQYKEWTAKKELRLKKNGEYYIVSPWALVWDDENYYLIAYDAEANLMKHYRVDKMLKLSLLPEKRLGKEQFQNLDLASLSKKTFAMYGGKDEHVSLYCENSMASVILDRFGKDVTMIPIDEKHFKVNLLVSVSRQFYGWVTGLGSSVKIIGPEHVVHSYKEYVSDILDQYGEEKNRKISK